VVFYLFLTAAHSSFLGVLITLARREIYPLQSGAASAWGLSALQDQQLAGLIMWVLAGMVYVMAALILAGIWIAGASSRSTNHASLR
jgi:putative membrane protein